MNRDCKSWGWTSVNRSFHSRSYGNLSCDFIALNLLNRTAVYKAIKDFHPNYILHLAAFSSVGLSWLRPVESFKNNTNIFLNLIDAVRKVGCRCRILSVGSSEEYGNIRQEMLPLREETQLNPVSPYAVARLAQEHLSQVFVDGYDLDIVMTRSFNHIGPGQKEIFVVSSFAKQMVAMQKAGLARRQTKDRRCINSAGFSRRPRCGGGLRSPAAAGNKRANIQCLQRCRDLAKTDHRYPVGPHRHRH